MWGVGAPRTALGPVLCASPTDQALKEPGLTPGDWLVIRLEVGHKSL